MDSQQQLLKYVDLFLRWKKFIILCALISIAVGLGLCLRIEKIYQSTALIIFEPQKINPSAMSPDPAYRSRLMEETIYTLSQQITSRSGLEQIINKFGLYLELRQKYPMEIVVETMQKNDIKIEPAREGNFFKVSYQGSLPQKVMLVTNELAAKFIEGNLRERGERASETSAYTKDELKLAKERLDGKEAMMRDYKLQYYNEMPQQREINVARLNALQSSSQNIENNIQQQEQTKALIQDQLGLRERLATQELVLGAQAGADTAGRGSLRVETPAEAIARLRLELVQLSSKYTERHPEVIKKTRELEELQQRQMVASEPARAQSLVPRRPGDAGAGQDAQSPGQLLDPQGERLKVQLKEAEFTIRRLKEEKVEISKQIEQYKKWVEAAPVREAEWATLSRDHEQLSQHYQALVRRDLEAEAAESIERQQKGSRFKIVEPARLPEKPIKPNFAKMMLMALAIGLGLGSGVAFTADYFDTSFRDPAELEAYIGIPIACTVPYISTKKEKLAQNIKGACWAVLLTSLALAIAAATVYFWHKGVIVI